MSNSDFSSGGGTTGQHAPLGPRTFAAAPTVANGFNTIRIPLVAVACWRLNDPAFDFDSSFVLPSFRDELTKLAQLVSANPGCPAALFGHADPVGSDDVNKSISDRRAIAIYALLTRQPPKWEELYSKAVDGDAWGTRSIQAMLNTVPDGSGVPYYAGPTDGDYGPNTKSAVRSFQADAGLAVDGDAGPNTRKVLFGAYMDLLCTPSGSGFDAPAPFRMAPADFVGKGADPNGKMALQGCSRFNPVVLLPTSEMGSNDKTTRNADDAPNRRILLFLFRKNTEVGPSDWPCPRVGEAADACKGQFWPDGNQRRKNGDALRRYQETRDTMACRFYDRLARRSPCEGGQSARKVSWVVQVPAWVTGDIQLFVLDANGEKIEQYALADATALEDAWYAFDLTALDAALTLTMELRADGVCVQPAVRLSIGVLVAQAASRTAPTDQAYALTPLVRDAKPA